MVVEVLRGELDGSGGPVVLQDDRVGVEKFRAGPGGLQVVGDVSVVGDSVRWDG